MENVEQLCNFATTGVSIRVPSIYFRGTYGQIIKLAKKPRTLILKIFVTIEKWSFSVQLLNTMYNSMMQWLRLPIALADLQCI
jgi:hypothetical protein